MLVATETVTLSRLIGSIYDCAIDPNLWESTLGQVSQAIGSANAVIMLVEIPSTRILLASSHGIEPEWLGRMEQYGPDNLALWSPVLASPELEPDEPLAGSRVFAPATFEANRYYQEWGKPQGLRDILALFSIREPQRMATFGFGSVSDYTDQQLAMVRILAPHLRRAVVISNLLDAASIAAAKFELALQGLSVGVVLVDDQCRLVYANRAAETLFHASDVVRLEENVVGTISLAASRSLRQAVATAAHNESALGSAGIGIPIVSAEGQSKVAHVLPLPAGNPRRRWTTDAVAAIFITPAATPIVPVAALRSLFDLTAAEGRVLAALAEGKDVAGIAETLAVAETTVRTHIARIMSKTGTNRQTELLQLVASLTPPVNTGG